MKIKYIIIRIIIAASLLSACEDYKRKQGNTVMIYHTSMTDTLHHIKFKAHISTGTEARTIEVETPYSITFDNGPFIVTAYSPSDTIKLQMEMISHISGSRVWGSAVIGTLYSFAPQGDIGYFKSY